MLQTIKTLLKEIEDTNKYRHPLLLDWKEDFVKISTLYKVIYKFSVIPFKISITFFTEVEQNLKFIYYYKNK